MDAMTVAFTGLIIYNSGTVSLVTAEKHQALVTIENSAGTKVKEIRKGIAFEGLDTGSVGEAIGFRLPSLTSVFPGTLSVEAAAVMDLRLQGGTLGPYLGYAVCEVDGGPTMYWAGFEWTVRVKPGAKVVIDGTPYDLDNGTRVHIANDFIGNPTESHVKMYKKALKGAGMTEHLPACGEPYPPMAGDPKAPSVRFHNNPVTCPPMALK